MSGTFRILAHEEDQYTVMLRKYQADFLSIVLEQTKVWASEFGNSCSSYVSYNVINIFSFKICKKNEINYPGLSLYAVIQLRY